MKTVIRTIVLVCAASSLASMGCGGGSGIGPGEVAKREDTLKDMLLDDWSSYRAGDYPTSIGMFTETLNVADANDELSAAVRNQVKSEAQNGIGWAWFKTQELDSADVAFDRSTRLNRQNSDAWAGWSGVALAKKQYTNAVQYAVQVLQLDDDYQSDKRFFDESTGGRPIGHDNFDERHVRLLLAEAYFHLGRYSEVDRADPGNATAQLRLATNRQFTFTDPGALLAEISDEAQKLH